MLAYHVYLYCYRARSSLLCQSTAGAAADHGGGLGAEAQDGAGVAGEMQVVVVGLSLTRVRLSAPSEFAVSTAALTTQKFSSRPVRRCSRDWA